MAAGGGLPSADVSGAAVQPDLPESGPGGALPANGGIWRGAAGRRMAAALGVPGAGRFRGADAGVLSAADLLFRRPADAGRRKRLDGVETGGGNGVDGGGDSDAASVRAVDAGAPGCAGCLLAVVVSAGAVVGLFHGERPLDGGRGLGRAPVGAMFGVEAGAARVAGPMVRGVADAADDDAYIVGADGAGDGAGGGARRLGMGAGLAAAGVFVAYRAAVGRVLPLARGNDNAHDQPEPLDRRGSLPGVLQPPVAL